MNIIGECDICEELVNWLTQIGDCMVCEHCEIEIKDAVGEYDDED